MQVYIAAFAVSAYSSTYHRAGCKPFNPVLGETYECERPDRGFRFISEQVWAQGEGPGSRSWAGEDLYFRVQKLGPGHGAEHGQGRCARQVEGSVLSSPQLQVGGGPEAGVEGILQARPGKARPRGRS